MPPASSPKRGSGAPEPPAQATSVRSAKNGTGRRSGKRPCMPSTLRESDVAFPSSLPRAEAFARVRRGRAYFPVGRDEDPVFMGFVRSHPVLAPYADLAWAFGREDDGLPALPRLDAVLRAEVPALSVRFVPQAPKPRRRSNAPIRLEDLYDGAIVTRNEVPTRSENVHDLFNALAWALFPKAKRAIHTRQAAEQAARVADGPARLPGVRTRAQDRLAMLDEGGALEVALEERSGAALDALMVADGAYPILFGHAICEHLALGGAPLRCFALPLAVRGGGISAVDDALAASVDGVAAGVLGAGAAVPLAPSWFFSRPFTT
ncbi:hypothetical protein OUZ56_033150 [Daphnia magna]|uniref:DUF3025 domain-containing protein n=1 Tax=Daphnia magna TaxID=35525 RepID=A0ABR0BAC1_9CRUS|nr:hypothetical protein OUZ56_033150 [Daphnia magna]